MPSYTKSNELLNEYISNENLKKHCYGVEACMKFYAQKLGLSENDIEKWVAAGLLHDLDYEKMPKTHPNSIVPILEENGYDSEIIEAILGHGYPNWSTTERKSQMAYYLFACDELSGFIVAYSLMKPGKLNDVDAKSVIKKLKDKAFARGVNRDDIAKGLEEIGLTAEEHVSNVIEALKSETRLGLS